MLLLECFGCVLSHFSSGRRCLCLRNSVCLFVFLFFFSPPGSHFAEQESLTGRMSRACLNAPPHKNGLTLISLIPLLKARPFSCAARVLRGFRASVCFEPRGIIGSRTSPLGCRWLVSHVSLCPCWMLSDCDVVTSACVCPTEQMAAGSDWWSLGPWGLVGLFHA